MQVYDLMLKLEGLKGMTQDGLADDYLNELLFRNFSVQDRRSRFSTLKSGKNPLSLDHATILTEEFNARLSLRFRANGITSYLRAEDWYRPLPEFFAQLGKTIDQNEEALQRANAGMLTALQKFEDNRERDHALVVERYDPTIHDGTRFPETAEPVDPVELPPTRLQSGQMMSMRIAHPMTPWPARGWLFYLRTPDERDGSRVPSFLWEQDRNDMLFWHSGGPFELPANYEGPLPGFPATVTSLTGSVTAFLLLEPLNSTAIAGLLAEPTRNWNGQNAPSFEGAVHLVTCERRLFQKGASLSYEKGQLAFERPKLLVRRYKIVP